MRKITLIALAFICFSLPANAAEKEEQMLRTISDLNLRIANMEEQNRRLQGRIEDLEYKIRQVENKQAAANAAAAASAKKAETLPANPYQKFVKPGEPKQVESEDTEQTGQEDVAEAPEKIEDLLPAEGSDQYDKAFIQLGKLKYDEAEKSFKNFVAKHPDSALVPEAYYWLGEISYAKEDYNGAAVNYLKSYKKDPKGKKAPEAILKTASSLKALGKKPEACKNYQRFLAEFPKAHGTLRFTAQNDMKSLGCK